MNKIIVSGIMVMLLAGCKQNDDSDLLPVPPPTTSTTFMPQDTIPDECRNAKAETYIAEWEAGAVDFETIQPDETIEPGKAYKTFNPFTGGVITLPTCKPQFIPAGWKELSDSPDVIGITLTTKGDHEPHYHSEAECYYVAEGRSQVLAGDEYPWLEKGQYLYVEGNAIHNTPFMGDGRFSIIYWYPGHANWDNFKYYYRGNTSHSEEASEAFDIVDNLRLEFMNLKPYGQNWFDPRFY